MEEVKAPVGSKGTGAGFLNRPQPAPGREWTKAVQGHPCAFSWPASLHEHSQWGQATAEAQADRKALGLDRNGSGTFHPTNTRPQLWEGANPNWLGDDPPKLIPRPPVIPPHLGRASNSITSSAISAGVNNGEPANQVPVTSKGEQWSRVVSSWEESEVRSPPPQRSVARDTRWLLTWKWSRQLGAGR